jgi:hypothetical protein
MADDPILLIVRRGAQRRFEALERKTSHLDVKVIWDRRQRNQRQSIGVVQKEQRVSDRRSHSAPPSWQLADFTVAVPRPSKRSK